MQALHLGVAGVALADLLVGGVEGVAVGVAAFHIGDAAHAVEHGFGAPETTPTQGDGFKLSKLLIFHNFSF